MKSAVAALLLSVLGAMSTAAAGIAPESATTQVRSVLPGRSYRDAVVIRNNGRTAADIKIYQTDYSFSADGRNDYASPATLPRSNARWLRLSQEQVSIGPGERRSVDYEVRVPDDTRLVGTYWSAIMIEPVVGAEAAGAQRERPQLRQLIRHVIQVVTEIGTTGRSEIAFTNAQLLDDAGRRWFSVDMENTGERWLRSTLWLELHDPQGRLAGRFPGRNLRTFPATSVRNRVDLSSVPPGKYVALLVADAGRSDVFGTEMELDLR